MKENLGIIKKVGSKIFKGKTSLLIKKYSPEILIAVGVAGVVSSTVMACNATIKAQEVLESHKEVIDTIHKCEQNVKDGSYSEEDKVQDLIKCYTHTGVDLLKLYSPAVFVSTASIACLLGSHGIMKRRNAAITAAYNLVAGHFADYRSRVRDKYGDNEDRYFYHGLTTEKMPQLKENGEVDKKKKLQDYDVVDPNQISQYAKFFDDSSEEWQRVPEYNMLFLKSRQNYMNDLLHSRGHLFLNEVYDSLGIPRTKEGAVVGWVMSEDGDNFVDFGLYKTYYGPNRDFVNGYEDAILLDFNVDGVIYDLI